MNQNGKLLVPHVLARSVRGAALRSWPGNRSLPGVRCAFLRNEPDGRFQSKVGQPSDSRLDVVGVEYLCDLGSSLDEGNSDRVWGSGEHKRLGIFAFLSDRWRDARNCDLGLVRGQILSRWRDLYPWFLVLMLGLYILYQNHGHGRGEFADSWNAGGKVSDLLGRLADPAVIAALIGFVAAIVSSVIAFRTSRTVKEDAQDRRDLNAQWRGWNDLANRLRQSNTDLDKDNIELRRLNSRYLGQVDRLNDQVRVLTRRLDECEADRQNLWREVNRRKSDGNDDQEHQR